MPGTATSVPWVALIRLHWVFATLVLLLVLDWWRVPRSQGFHGFLGLKLGVFYLTVQFYGGMFVMGGGWLAAAVVASGLLAAGEMAAAFLGDGREGAPYRCLARSGVVMALLLRGHTESVLVAIGLLALCLPVLSGNPARAHQRVAGTALIVFLAGVMPLYLIRLREAAPGAALFLFSIVVVNDAFAEAAGRLAGRTRFFVSISPRKTLEGALGGLAASAAAALLFAPLLPGSTLRCVLLAVVGAVAGALGDLVFSALKRSVGQKDFGSLLPAHGGILDRLDSLFFAGPVFYHLLLAWG